MSGLDPATQARGRDQGDSAAAWKRLPIVDADLRRHDAAGRWALFARTHPVQLAPTLPSSAGLTRGPRRAAAVSDPRIKSGDDAVGRWAPPGPAIGARASSPAGEVRARPRAVQGGAYLAVIPAKAGNPDRPRGRDQCDSAAALNRLPIVDADLRRHDVAAACALFVRTRPVRLASVQREPTPPPSPRPAFPASAARAGPWLPRPGPMRVSENLRPRAQRPMRLSRPESRAPQQAPAGPSR